MRDGHGRVVLSGRLKLFKLKKFTMPGKSFTIITSVFELEESRYVAENLPLAATPGHSALSGGPRESNFLKSTGNSNIFLRQLLRIYLLDYVRRFVVPVLSYDPPAC